jgi:hypothetical protein
MTTSAKSFEGEKLKKSKRDRKEKKSHKKEKKSHKEKKSKKETRRHDKNQKQTVKPEPSVATVELLSGTEHEEVAAFKHAVQGHRALAPKELSKSSLIDASHEDIAKKLGLPKGLIRTSEDTFSLTQKYSRNLFGDDEDNPAKRQRMLRERAAQNAIEKARTTLKARAALAASQDKGPSSVTDIMSRFSSSASGK